MACTPINAGVTSPSCSRRSSGRRPVAATAFCDLERGFVQVSVNRHVELVRELADVRAASRR